jgi:phosphatidylglycerophosphate synthase
MEASSLLGALVGIGVGLWIVALRTRRPVPGIDLPCGIDDYARIWQKMHNAPDVDPKKNPLHVAYLHLTYSAATPLARLGVLPDWLTLIGLWLAGVVTALGWMGSFYPILAGVLMFVSSLIDGIDGAVAGLTNRSTLRGHVLDSVVDRLSEALFIASIVLAAGVAWSQVAGAGVLAMSGIVLLEYTRARVTTAGGGAIGTITIGERPTRVIGCAVCLIGMGVAPKSVEFIGRTSLLIVAAASFIGFAQLAWYAWRNLGGPNTVA